MFGHGQAALKQLKELTEIGERDVCTKEQASAIVDFVKNQLKDAADGTKRSLPEPLGNFIVAYGMKVSGICSQRMLRKLPLEKDLRYTKDWSGDMNEFFSRISDRSYLGMVLGPLIKPGEVILPVDLMQALPSLGEHIYQMVPKAMGLSRLKFICEKVFQPLYEPLMLPLAHLNRAGFSNREFFGAWKFNHKGQFWSRAVFLCDIAKKIEHDSEQKAAIMKDEQAAIEMEVKGLFNGYMDRFETEGEFPTTPVEAKPMPTGDKILGQFDSSMKSLVKAFDANKDHVQLLRERIMERGLQVITLMFKDKGSSKEFEETLNALQIQTGSKLDLEEARKQLTKLMESPETSSPAKVRLAQKSKFLWDLIKVLVVSDRPSSIAGLIPIS